MNPCKRYKVVAKGFNRGGEVTATNGNEEECSNEIGNCGCTHAEINLLKEMPNPEEVWVSVSPCINCAKALVSGGVKMVRYRDLYRRLEGIEYLVNNGVSVLQD